MTRSRARRAAATVTVLAAACAAPQGEPPAPPPRAEASYAPLLGSSGAEAGRWGDRWLLEANAIPAAWLVRDVDGTDVDPDEQDAAGFAVRAAAGNRDQSLGVLFQGFRADGGGLDLTTVGLDGDVRATLDRESLGMFAVRAGAAVGAAWLDTAGDDPGGQLAAQLRLGIDFQPSARLFVGASFGGIVAGHPGETEAYGTFVSVGGGLVF